MAILDVGKREIVEAVGKGVVVTPLDRYLSESHRVLIIEPDGWSPERGREALARARSQVGAGYDYLGIVGAPDDERFYCLELTAW